MAPITYILKLIYILKSKFKNSCVKLLNIE